jgi:hypothetical protein
MYYYSGDEMDRDFVGPTKRMTRRQAGKLLCLIPFFPNAFAYAQTLNQRVHSELDCESSDPQLNGAFRWAKLEAISYVFDNDPVGPWYEAALPGRQAFCIRDASHQADGAQALGLSRYNHNMLRRFAENISASRDWCSYWEIDRENHPAPVDYKNDAEFWYNLPANYDVLDACYRMYLWSGDKSYVEDPVFLNFYDRTIVDYTERWDLTPDRIMKRTSKIQEPPFFRGDPTYEESSRDNLVGIDLLATQYAAFRAYSAIQAIRGNMRSARHALQTAVQIKLLINTVWWNPSEEYFYAFLDKEHRFLGRAGSDLLYRDAADDGPKVMSALNTLLGTMKTESEEAVESKSHYAEILYRYGRAEAAYAEIIDLARDGRKRREYPEVSYSVIGAMITGLVGVRVRPRLPLADMATGRPLEPVIETMPQLTAKTNWVALRNLPIQGSEIDVRHDRNRSTTVTNSGRNALNWKAGFPGSFAELQINGKTVNARVETTFLNRPITWLETNIPPGKTWRVQVPNG